MPAANRAPGGRSRTLDAPVAKVLAAVSREAHAVADPKVGRATDILAADAPILLYGKRVQAAYLVAITPGAEAKVGAVKAAELKRDLAASGYAPLVTNARVRAAFAYLYKQPGLLKKLRA